MATSQKYSTFYLNGICFGVPIERVQEVLEFQEITPIPLSPAVLPGIINLRGQIITTIDLKTRLELTESEAQGQPMMIVLRTGEGPMNLIVDKIGSVVDVDPALFEKPTETLKTGVRAVTTHVCKLEGRLLLVLDTEKVIQLQADRRAMGEPGEGDKAPVH
ncbi:MAG TPA: chemotaxis protein CheW [Candidatus Sulfotelmatobacter sp.]|nr:chemotaxis protein CheW [Candidatus Sulfotelmatobacter sp.]